MKRSTMNLVAGLSLAALMAVFAAALYQTSGCAAGFFAIASAGIAIAAVGSAASISKQPESSIRAKSAVDPTTAARPPEVSPSARYSRSVKDGIVTEVIEEAGIRTTMTAPLSTFDYPKPVYQWAHEAQPTPSGFRTVWMIEQSSRTGIDFHLNGTEFEDRPAAAKSFAEGSGQAVRLEYDTTNARDKNAIAVYGSWIDASGERLDAKLGYLPRRNAKHICTTMGRPELCGCPLGVSAMDAKKPVVLLRVFAKNDKAAAHDQPRASR